LAEAVRPRGAVSFRTVFAGLIASLALAALAAGWAYFHYLRYERVAARHLPADTTAAARIDVEQVVLFAPVRKHLIPLIDQIGDAPGREPRLQRIARETGVKVALELRELVLARGPTSADWVLVIGGRFPDHGLIEGIDRVLRAEGSAWRLSADGRSLLGPSGIALGQAKDAALVLASNPARLAQALQPSDTYARLGLKAEGAGGFAASRAALRELAAVPVGLRLVSLPNLALAERVRGELVLGSVVEVNTQIDLGVGVDAARFANDLQRALSSLFAAWALLPGVDYAGERAALAKAKVEVGAPNVVTVRFPWLREDVERGAASLAALIRDGVGAGTP
jgi:hypothetical protein